MLLGAAGVALLVSAVNDGSDALKVEERGLGAFDKLVGDMFSASSALALVVTTVSGLVFLYWLSTVRANIRDWSGDPIRSGSLRDAFAFGAPLVNLFKPHEVMREVWTRSHDGVPHNDRPGLLRTWSIAWVLWGIARLVSPLTAQMAFGKAQEALATASFFGNSLHPSRAALDLLRRRRGARGGGRGGGGGPPPPAAVFVLRVSAAHEARRTAQVPPAPPPPGAPVRF
ncbi:DUF4328 domain-containing protein [Yinghuangia soli]|uniref:DUF4328 domain-containing protein n=1 Tax=Yinghuangia soli TaxID=2908204 RepID=A0AA41Q4X2_9ACTN|nr:DUF4328 domain-containing protein [Yinghuangia soli]MCF2530499.1 DUF4328 domain-containing protein [Yinghuangia soli]